MMPKVNPKQMQQMMQRMGISQQEIPAVEVIIRCKDKDIVISEPSVLKVDMMGDKIFQISGAALEHPREVVLNDDDIKTVMDQAGVDEETAIKTIKECDNDLAMAILKLKAAD